MDIDQQWGKDNIDLIMKEFLKINPEFEEKTNSAMAAKSRHKKLMKKSMDTPTYRPYYYIVKNSTDKINRIKKQNRELRDEVNDIKTHLSCWHQNYKTAERKLIDEFGEKSYEYQIVFGKH